MKNKNIEKLDGRFDLHQVKTATCELRSQDGEENSRELFGYCLMWSQMSELLWGDYHEIIEKGAISQEVIDKSDILFVWNHERWTMPFARKRPNASPEESTLTLELDEVGLKYTAKIANTQEGDALIEAVRRGDVSGVSLAFIPEDWEWEELGDGNWLRKVTKISELFDISPTSYPCYDSVTISNRSMESLQQHKQSIIDERSKVQINSERRKREFEIFELQNS
jgi:HK97 family phage prohead protease